MVSFFLFFLMMVFTRGGYSTVSCQGELRTVYDTQPSRRGATTDPLASKVAYLC